MNDQTIIDRFLLLKSKRSRNTGEAYRRDLSRFREAIPGPLSSVSFGDLQDYQEELEGYSPASQARMMSAVKSLFRFACSIGALAMNPADAISLPRVEDTSDLNYLSRSEARRLLKAARSERDKLLIDLGLRTGLRASELAGLSMKNFIRSPGGQRGVRVTSKRGRTRVVGVPRELWGRIKAFRKTGRLFPGKTGKGISRAMVHKIVSSTAQRAKIDKPVSAHTLRHTFGTLAAHGGASPDQIMEAMGHSDARVAFRYAKVSRMLKKTAADYVKL